MPRQSRGSGRPAAAPSRPMAPARPAAPVQQQTRPASTAAHPPAAQQPVQQAPVSQGPGLFGQMASTAAGVAVGSSIGHAIGGFFGGGSSAPAPEVQQQAQQVQSSAYEAPRVCHQDVTNFRQCMDQNQGDLNICGWYLDQLKACQAAATQYSGSSM